MSPKSSAPTLKQSKLSFGASKSAAAVNKAKKDAVLQPSSSTSKRPTRAAAAKPSPVDVESREEEINVDDIELLESEPSSESEIEKDEQESSEEWQGTTVKRETRASTAKAKAKAGEAIATTEPSGAQPAQARNVKKETVEEGLEVEAESRPKLNIKAKAYDTIFREAKGKMAYAQPIHATTEIDGKDVQLNRVDDILRIFDLNYDYGPCVGMTRLERWQRANRLGLNPPAEIYDILMTKEGLTESRYAQNVLYGRV